MTRSKPQESGTTKEIWEARIKNAIWTCEAFNFDASYALKWINKGLLGFKIDEKGEQTPTRYGTEGRAKAPQTGDDDRSFPEAFDAVTLS